MSGQGTSSKNNLTLLGYAAARNATGYDNTFIGANTGTEVSGGSSTFHGSFAGQNAPANH